MVLVPMDTARGLLMPMLTMVMEAMAVLAMEVMVDTDMERGLLMPMPTMVTEAMAVLAMEVMVDTDTARGPLMPTTVMEAMAVLAMVMVPMDMASNFTTKHKNSRRTKNLYFSIPDLNLFF